MLCHADARDPPRLPPAGRRGARVGPGRHRGRVQQLPARVARPVAVQGRHHHHGPGAAPSRPARATSSSAATTSPTRWWRASRAPPRTTRTTPPGSWGVYGNGYTEGKLFTVELTQYHSDGGNKGLPTVTDTALVRMQGGIEERARGAGPARRSGPASRTATTGSTSSTPRPPTSSSPVPAPATWSTGSSGPTTHRRATPGCSAARCRRCAPPPRRDPPPPQPRPPHPPPPHPDPIRGAPLPAVPHAVLLVERRRRDHTSLRAVAV